MALEGYFFKFPWKQLRTADNLVLQWALPISKSIISPVTFFAKEPSSLQLQIYSCIYSHSLPTTNIFAHIPEVSYGFHEDLSSQLSLKWSKIPRFERKLKASCKIQVAKFRRPR